MGISQFIKHTISPPETGGVPAGGGGMMFPAFTITEVDCGCCFVSYPLPTSWYSPPVSGGELGMVELILKRYSIAINKLPLRYTYMEKSKQDSSQRIFNSAENKQLRQTLRTHGTSAEATMWRMLKSEQICGVKFRRQFSVGPYILDFYCPRLKICIELDGDHHYSRQGYEHDLTRNTYLSHEHGITILRYENKDVFKFPEMIRAEITNLVKEKLDGLK